jgi:hypothetical protein
MDPTDGPVLSSNTALQEQVVEKPALLRGYGLHQLEAVAGQAPQCLMPVIQFHGVCEPTRAQFLGNEPGVLAIVLGFVGLRLFERPNDPWVRGVGHRAIRVQGLYGPKRPGHVPPVDGSGLKPKADALQMAGRKDGSHLLAECGNTWQVVGDSEDGHHRPVLEMQHTSM